MKSSQHLLLLSLALGLPSLSWASTQQEKMADCNAAAKADKLSGDERKEFMSRCLKKDYVIKSDSKTELTPQQLKMKNCNASAKEKELKGDERKQFMSSCLKNKES